MRLRSRWGLTSVAIVLAVAFGAPALAEPTDADALIREGLALRRQRRDTEALDAFRRAYAALPEPRTLAQVALAEQALGRWVEAEVDLERALAAGDDAWIDRHRSVLAAGLADIRKHLGGLEVETDVPDGGLWVNGVRAASLPLRRALRVEAGNLVVEVRAPGYWTARRLTSVEAGETAHEMVRLVPLSAPPPDESAPARAQRQTKVPQPEPPTAHAGARLAAPSALREVTVDRAMRSASFVLFAAALVEFGAGAYFGAKTLNAKADRDKGCQTGCDAMSVALDEQARSFADRSTAWFAVGAVAAGAGAGLFWMSRRRASAVVTLGLAPQGAVVEGAW